MIEKIKKANAILKYHGAGTLLVFLFRKMIQDSFGEGRYKRIFLFELSEPRPAVKSLEFAKDHVFRFASAEDIERLHNEAKWDISEDDIKAFSNGDQCLLQVDGEQMVGYAWLASTQLVEVAWGFHVNMADDTLYNYKGFTAEEYRGKGFQPLRHLKLLEHARASGKKKLFGYVDHLNLKSLRGVSKSGYRRVGVLRCINRGGKIRFKMKIDQHSWGMKRRV